MSDTDLKNVQCLKFSIKKYTTCQILDKVSEKVILLENYTRFQILQKASPSRNHVLFRSTR